MVAKAIGTVGRMEFIDLLDDGIKHVHAKIDTGADTSSVWASDIEVDEAGMLHFKFFDETSELYTGNVVSKKKFTVALVRSSNGQEEVRYSVKLPIVIRSRRVLATFTLADRSRNKFPILIGRKLLHKKFVVDVSKNKEAYEAISKAWKKAEEHAGSSALTESSKQDPYKFYKEHYLKQRRSQS